VWAGGLCKKVGEGMSGSFEGKGEQEVEEKGNEEMNEKI